MEAKMKKVKGKAGQGNMFWDALLVSLLLFLWQGLEAIDLSSPLFIHSVKNYCASDLLIHIFAILFARQD
jgi:hypothetical protein